MSQQEVKPDEKGNRIDKVVSKIINIEGPKMEKLEPKKEEPKPVEPKKEEPKPMEPKKDEPKKVMRKKLAPKKVVLKKEEPKDEPKGSKRASPTEEQPERPSAKAFYCRCRDCKLYFGKGNPIECVNPNIVEIRYPKWKFTNSASAKVPVFRRPADPDTRKDLQNKRRKQ